MGQVPSPCRCCTNAENCVIPSAPCLRGNNSDAFVCEFYDPGPQKAPPQGSYEELQYTNPIGYEDDKVDLRGRKAAAAADDEAAEGEHAAVVAQWRLVAVDLDCTGFGQQLGLSWEEPSEAWQASLFVTGVSPGSALEAWNCSHPSSSVGCGSFVLRVGTTTGPAAKLARALQESRALGGVISLTFLVLDEAQHISGEELLFIHTKAKAELHQQQQQQPEQENQMPVTKTCNTFVPLMP
mmetsp:Transcript_75495/g.190969  ORF Transcript_75495/g.190969 Transcript_75495/m.190969 type:complete len:239 (-) Transcript_75495:304-1020(-)